MINLMLGDCLERMKEIPDDSVDLVLCDPPYGTTRCKWDAVIPFAPMWDQLHRVAKERAAIVMTCAQPFTSALVMSNPKHFRYEWVWDKVNKYTGTLLANKRPLRRHENIVVFSRKSPQPYNKQYREGKPYSVTRTKGHGEYIGEQDKEKRRVGKNNGQHNPCSVLSIKADNKREAGHHPTQKPVDLMAYMIRTYTNPGDVVLDFTMGSGTTGVACKQEGRSFIGIELDKEYFEIAKKRIEDD